MRRKKPIEKEPDVDPMILPHQPYFKKGAIALMSPEDQNDPAQYVSVLQVIKGSSGNKVALVKDELLHTAEIVRVNVPVYTGWDFERADELWADGITHRMDDPYTGRTWLLAPVP